MERKVLGRGIKLSCVAEARNGTKLVDSVDAKSTNGRVAVGNEEITRSVGRHDLTTDGAVGDHHVVLLASDGLGTGAWT